MGRFPTGIVFFMLLMAISTLRVSDGRELRPSPHGFTNQYPPSATGDNSPESVAFFKGTAPPVPFPAARNMSDPSSWSSDGATPGWSKDGGGGHVRTGLLAASMAFGISGVVLLVVAASIFLLRHQKKQRSSINHVSP